MCQNKQNDMNNKKKDQNFEKLVLGTYESTFKIRSLVEKLLSKT